MNYQTVYDISKSSYNWVFPFLGILITILLIIFTKVVRRNLKVLNRIEAEKEKKEIFYNFNNPYVSNMLRRLPMVFTILASIATVFITYGSINYYVKLNEVIQNQEYSVVEDKIKIINKFETNRIQNFKVGKFIFNVADINSIRISFWKSGTYEDFLVEGQDVKVYFYGKYILRVDLMK